MHRGSDSAHRCGRRPMVRELGENLRRGMRWGLAAAGCVALVAAAGCVVNESKPLPKVNPIQADRQIPQDELLDVVVHPLDPGIPPNLDPKALDKKRINPDIRKAESRYVATLLRSTLETSGQWGAVRVAPESAQFIDVIVSGKIVESTGAKLALDITVKDSTGRVWINARRYQTPPDTGSYKTDAALKARDPFQNLYSAIANDMVAARELREDREGAARAESGAHPHLPRRGRGAGERVRAQPVQPLRLQLPARSVGGSLRRRHRRHGGVSLGTQEIRRREGPRPGSEGDVGDLPVRSRPPGHRRRGPHAEAHRYRRGAIPRVAQAPPRAVPGGERHSRAGRAGGHSPRAAGSGRSGRGALIEGDMTEAVTATPGRRLAARYILHERLGVGGQGEVWRAYDPERGVDIALKILQPSPGRAADAWAALLNEHESASHLDHPGTP